MNLENLIQDLLSGEKGPRLTVDVAFDAQTSMYLGLTIFFALLLALVISKRI